MLLGLDLITTLDCHENCFVFLKALAIRNSKHFLLSNKGSGTEL